MEDIRTVLAEPPFSARETLFQGLGRMRERLTYEELITPIRERMMRLIWRIVRDPDEAEDTLQEVLALIWKKLDRISSHPNPQALVMKICADSAIDSLRRQLRNRRNVDPGVLDCLAAPDSDTWERMETEAKIKEALGRLPRNQAIAVVMRILKGQSYAEIARALGCRENTARTHVLRGRVKLSRWLSHLRPSRTKESMP